LSGESIEEEMKNNWKACHFAQRVRVRAGFTRSWWILEDFEDGTSHL